jgi:hypothetical protein
MYFLTTLDNDVQVMKLDTVPRDEEGFIKEYGYPVEISVYDPGNPNINDERLLATPEQVAWFDEGEHSEDLEDIQVKHINRILSGYDGWCLIEMVDEEEEEEWHPSLYDNKVTLTYADAYDNDDWDLDIDDVPDEEEYKNDIYERDN